MEFLSAISSIILYVSHANEIVDEIFVLYFFYLICHYFHL